jgi:hypothetical protein
VIGGVCDKQTMDASAFERALITYARVFPLRKGKLRVIDRLWRAAAGRRGTVRLAHLRYGGLKMPCDLAEMIQRQLYFFGTYFLEEHILNCWIRVAKEAKVIFDVGANSGIYSLAALASQPNALVYAFEPTPEIASRLRQTAELNHLYNLIVHESRSDEKQWEVDLAPVPRGLRRKRGDELHYRRNRQAKRRTCANRLSRRLLPRSLYCAYRFAKT